MRGASIEWALGGLAVGFLMATWMHGSRSAAAPAASSSMVVTGIAGKPTPVAVDPNMTSAEIAAATLAWNGAVAVDDAAGAQSVINSLTVAHPIAAKNLTQLLASMIAAEQAGSSLGGG